MATQLKPGGVIVVTVAMAIMVTNHFSEFWLSQLLRDPDAVVKGVLNQHPYECRIVIPNYMQRIATHYRSMLGGSIEAFCNQAEIACDFQHFGIVIHFLNPVEILLHDDEMVLDEGLRYLMEKVGPVVIKNAYLNTQHRGYGHRNRFPHLNFHIDRSANQPTQYSMYTRDPTDPEQVHPRTASTLFTANIVGHLQALCEGTIDPQSKGVKGTYTIFTRENMEKILGEVVMEQSWDEPKGVGEIAMLDNRTCLHSSYYRDPHAKGYRIGVRYLA